MEWMVVAGKEARGGGNAVGGREEATRDQERQCGNRSGQVTR
jgi:hypothetical protein